MIAVSHVSYLNGRRHDLAALRAAADRAGAMLVVDHTQAAGYLPIRADLADFAFCAGYKWLLGTTGAALAFWNRDRQPNWRPSTAGWYSVDHAAPPDWTAPPALRPDAMRFTRGNPAHPSLYVLAEALEYLAAHDPRAVQHHVQGLTADLLARLDAAGIPTITPADPARHGASACIPTPHAAALAQALEARGVLVWSGRGRLRVSVHGYNRHADLDALMAALGARWRG